MYDKPQLTLYSGKMLKSFYSKIKNNKSVPNFTLFSIVLEVSATIIRWEKQNKGIQIESSSQTVLIWTTEIYIQKIGKNSKKPDRYNQWISKLQDTKLTYKISSISSKETNCLKKKYGKLSNLQ